MKKPKLLIGVAILVTIILTACGPGRIRVLGSTPNYGTLIAPPATAQAIATAHWQEVHTGDSILVNVAPDLESTSSIGRGSIRYESAIKTIAFQNISGWETIVYIDQSLKEDWIIRFANVDGLAIDSDGAILVSDKDIDLANYRLIIGMFLIRLMDQKGESELNLITVGDAWDLGYAAYMARGGESWESYCMPHLACDLDEMPVTMVQYNNMLAALEGIPLPIKSVTP